MQAMKGVLKSTFKYTVILLITGGLLYSAFKDIKFVDILETWKGARKGPILFSGVVVLLSHYFRALRWKLLLNPMGYKFSNINSYLSVLSGYAVNIIVPRGGEISRCITLNKLEGVPVRQGLGTVIAERIIDLIFLISSVALAFVIEFDVLLELINTSIEKVPDQKGKGGLFVVVVFSVSVLFFASILTFVIKSRIRKVLKLRVKIKSFLIGMKQGVLSIFRLEHNVLFFFYTFLIWGLYFLMAYFVIIAFPETESLGLEGALMVFVFGAIAMAVPLPGGAGSYHTIVPTGINMLYDIPKSAGTAFATIFHAWQTAVHLIVGALALVISQILIKRNAKKIGR